MKQPHNDKRLKTPIAVKDMQQRLRGAKQQLAGMSEEDRNGVRGRQTKAEIAAAEAALKNLENRIR